MMFTDKVVVVTGAASGIGRACALGFAKLGGIVCLVDKDADGLGQTEKHVAELGGKSSKYTLDVSKSEQVQDCVTAIVKTYNRLDVLINNAGVNADGTIAQLSEDAWDTAMSVNLKSVYLFCRAAWPHLQKQDRSAIVNMSSVMGIVGGSGAPAYCTAKAGILMLTRCLAKDGAKDGIRVNAVCPGYIDTPILRQGYEDDPNFEILKQQVMDSQPMGRIGTADEVAKAILFLASNDASFVSGTSLIIDGALSATQIDE
jgi:NAD(P)-dependent dehydrogenase (short-subunit alcohol dehydrogenase family)